MKLQARDAYGYAFVLLVVYLALFDRPLLAELWGRIPVWVFVVIGIGVALYVTAMIQNRRLFGPKKSERHE